MIGCSEMTPIKWDRLEYFLRVHTSICLAIMKKYRWVDHRYFYFDFYAGPGLYIKSDHRDLDGKLGSPVRALKILKEKLIDPGEETANHRPIDFRAWFYEPEEWPRVRLQHYLRQEGWDSVHARVKAYSCEEAIGDLTGRWPEIIGDSARAAYGLAFFDPNGLSPWFDIRKFAISPYFKHIDLLINVNTTGENRVRRSNEEAIRKNGDNGECFTLIQCLEIIGKKFIYLWKPVSGDQHHYSLIYCTNGPFPEFARHGFHKITSDEGQKIAYRMDRTREERRRSNNQTSYLKGMEDIPDAGQESEKHDRTGIVPDHPRSGDPAA